MTRPSDDASESDGETSRRGLRQLSSRTRRAFVSGTLGASIVTLAGCAGGGGPGVTETTEAPAMTEEETTEAMATPTEEETATEAMTEEATPAEEEEELPEGVSEEEFERGPVPEEYQTAASQAGEQRDPDALQAKEAVRFQEASDAAEAGFITPGPNCGNCAEYIPDMNGDGFGACAKVEGYIDPEDWCVLWEPIAEEEGGGAGEETTEGMTDGEETTESSS